MIRTLMILLALAFTAISASAHTASRSFSSWRAEGATLTANFETDARRATQLPEVQSRSDGDLAAGFAAHLATHVTVPSPAAEPNPHGDWRRTRAARFCLPGAN
jgi:hypothetical protein